MSEYGFQEYEGQYVEKTAIIAALNGGDITGKDGILNDPNCPLFVGATVEQIICQYDAADVAPVIHAYWIPLHEGVNLGGSWDMRRCSNCGKRSLMHKVGDPYCGQCGAKMDGEPTRANLDAEIKTEIENEIKLLKNKLKK